MTFPPPTDLQRPRVFGQPVNFHQRHAIILATTLLAGFFLLMMNYQARAEDTPKLLSLSATGSVKARPDMASVSVGVVTEAVAARDALDDNEESMSRILQSLRQQGISDDDINTSQFSISPRYARSNKSSSSQSIAGYYVTNTLTVTVRNVEELGGLLDRMVKLGSNRINSIRFDYSNMDKLLDDARQNAVRAAKQRARLYAEAAGVTLGSVVSISESGANIPRPMPMLRGGRAASAEAVSIAAGAQEITARINMSWEIDD